MQLFSFLNEWLLQTGTLYEVDLWECTAYGNEDYYILAKDLILLEN